VAGSCDITAHQAGDSNYNAATDVTRALTIEKAPLTVKADDATKILGAANPTFSKTSNGACDSQTSVEDPSTITPDPGATFTFLTDHYHYNWSTKGLTAGEYRIRANLADGTSPYVDICLTK